MAGEPDWLWNEPLGIPEAEDVGPPLTDADFAAWEAWHGVALPAALKRAYRQQDGGYIRWTDRRTDRGIFFQRLHNVEPVEAEYMDDMYWGSERERFDPARLFLLGGDDTGANILLHYGEPGRAGPAVYAHYCGSDIGLIADTVEELFRGRA
jgi:hypothetical protein